ncbi:MAG: trypsin-like peptidase domain-containing protein [Anaerolineae bacterium]|nr:trypsin-like peptidase domain-containing protein [Anaerolineae bacterium]
MKRNQRFLMVCLAFLLLLSCGPNQLPTVTVTAVSEEPVEKQTEPVENPVKPASGDTENVEAKPTATPKATAAPDGDAEPTATRQTRATLLRATVQIVAMIKERGKLQPIWTGSGTILTKDGLILTNAHVVSDPDPDYQPDALGVAITVRSDDLPELKYLAEVRAIDEDLDLAVIQIVSDLGGKAIDPEKLNLTYVPIGDSDVLELGDLLEILGYPSIGGETITFTEGVVSGFTREPGVDGRAYIKTDATIAGGNSGGLAANENGHLIGVPTQVGYGGANRFADCRYLADTNNDGEIDEDDNCIPVGGFINAIRPVNLAKSLIESARLGIASPSTPKPEPNKPTGRPKFGNLLFAPDVTDQDLPARVVTRLPSGETHLYACWEYSGMSEDLTWEARWYRDGKYLEEVSWTPTSWSGSESGNWWVSIFNEDGLTKGDYKIELYVEDTLLVEGEILVGDAEAGKDPAMMNIVFSEAKTSSDKPANPTYLLPAGITEVYAFFDFANMTDGDQWTRTWYYEGRRLATKTEAWAGGAKGSGWTTLTSNSPLKAGSYSLELYLGNALMTAADFSVAGVAGENALGPITFASGMDDDGDPVDSGDSFPTGTAELRYFVDYTGMRDGMDFEARWYFDGEVLLEVNVTWDSGDKGTFTDNIYRKDGDSLWDGEYRLELYVEGEMLQSATATIGGGETPPDRPSDTGGLMIQGYIRDADTGRGISGALYVVLKPGVSISDWEGDEDDVYTAAQSDKKGYFELPDPLERGEKYSIIVWADGYTPVLGNNVKVGDEESPLEVEIELQQE